MNRNEAAFFEKCEEAKKIAFSFNNPLIVHHYDADGVSSGAIVAGAFLNQGKTFRRECIKKLDDEAIDRYLASGENEVIFVDLGGGNKRVNELKDVVIIDHHQTEGVEKLQVNPLLHGIDGGSEISAAGVAYCVFRTSADLAVVGAVGDMQSPLFGMNRWIVSEGEKSGEILVEHDLRFYGRYCRPLVQFLSYSDDPYIPGISYREDRSEQLFSDLGIKTEGERKYSDLNNEEKKSVISALANIVPGKKLVGESYVFPKRPKNETYEANEFSTLLNACGRHSKPDIGVRVCLKDESAYEEARSLLRLHRKMLREGVEFAFSNVQDLGPVYFLDGRGIIEEGVIGVICGMVLKQGWKKPIIGVSLGENNTIKISGRASKTLVENGLSLGDFMKKAALELGGIGGGHSVAAGASIPNKINEFLLFCGDYDFNRKNLDKV